MSKYAINFFLIVPPTQTVLNRYHHMYGRLADSILLGGGANRRFVLYDVLGEHTGPFLKIALQTATLPALCC
jgi:hypothetical protein